MTGSIARRYAKAILDVAREKNTLEQTGDQLRVLSALASDPQIAAAFANPLLSTSARRELARTIAGTLSLGPMMSNFLSLLADHRRLDHLSGIAQQYEKLVDQQLGRVRATITSATALSPEDLQSLVGAFERKTGRSVLAETRVDAELLGGVVVDIEGTIYDGSLRTQLRTLATHIAGGRSLL